MMLEHLEETEAAHDIERGIEKTLSEGNAKTRDMGGNHGTSDMGNAIRKAIMEAR